MGGKATKEVLTKIAESLDKGQGVDQKVLQDLFAKYDADKNGFLERDEIDQFLTDLWEFVHARITPKQASSVPWTEYPGMTPSTPHQPGCKGYQYIPQHLIKGVCTVNITAPASREGTAEFMAGALAALDTNKDNRISWAEFIAGIQLILLDSSKKAEQKS